MHDYTYLYMFAALTVCIAVISVCVYCELGSIDLIIVRTDYVYL